MHVHVYMVTGVQVIETDHDEGSVPAALQEAQQTVRARPFGWDDRGYWKDPDGRTVAIVHNTEPDSCQ